MSGYTIIEFKKCVLDPYNVKLRKYKFDRSIFIRVHCNNILLHPPIVYNTIDKSLDIGLAPFVKIGNSGILNFYSIAFEELQENTITSSSNNHNLLTLDDTSILVIDTATNKASNIIRASVDKGVIECIGLDNYNIYIKAAHSLNNYVVYLSTDGYLYKLSLNHSHPLIEPLFRCDASAISKYGIYTTTLCTYGTKTYAFIANKIYGTSIEIDERIPPKSSDHVYGYIYNNLCFVKIGHRYFVARLGGKNIYHYINDVEPLAILGKNSIVGISANNALVLLDLDKGNLNVIAKLDVKNLLDIYIDDFTNNIALTYNNSIYIFNLINRPVYLKLKANEVYSTTLVNDLLLIFRRNYIDIYRVDITPHRIYLEHLTSIPRYFIECIGLDKSNIMCIDRLGRMVAGDFKKVILDMEFNFISLRCSIGTAVYVHGHLIPILLGNTYNSSLQRISANDTLIVVAQHDVPAHNVISTIFKANRSSLQQNNNAVIDIPEIDSTYILLTNNNAYIVSSDNSKYKHMYLAILDGSKAIKKQFNIRQNIRERFLELTKDGLQVYLSGEHDIIEWGIGIEDSNLITLDLHNNLIINDKNICLSRDVSEVVRRLDGSVVGFLAICSNTILEQKGLCLSLSECKKLLRLFLVIYTNSGIRYISVPIDAITISKSYYVDISYVSSTYAQGTQRILLPRKCVDIADARIYLELRALAVELKFVNHCQNVGATVVINDNVLFLGPAEKRDIKLDIGIDNFIDDGGIQIVIYESTGNALRYSVPLDLQQIMARAYVLALKVAKIFGIKYGYEVLDNVYKGLRESREKKAS